MDQFEDVIPVENSGCSNAPVVDPILVPGTTRAVDVPMPAAPLGWRQPRESKEDEFFFDTRGWSNEKLQIAILYYGWGIFVGPFPRAPNRFIEKATPKCRYRSKSSFC